MTDEKQYRYLLHLVVSISGPLGPFRTVAEFEKEERDALAGLRAEDVPCAFDLIGCAPPNAWLRPDAFSSSITQVLATLAEKYPDPFLAQAKQRVRELPTAENLVDLLGDGDTPLLREVRALVAQRCLTPTERGLLREYCDQFGWPCDFRDAVMLSEWRTDTAMSLARGMYASRDFSAMPILADALQDAGCDNDDILNHCRGEGPHVRGCWVVDLVLGKA